MSITPELLRLMNRYQLAAVVVATLVSLAAWTVEGAAGVAAGGLVMAGNFWFLRTMMARVLLPDGSTGPVAKAGYLMALSFKFVVVLGALAVLVVVLRIHPFGIAFGMFTFFVGVALGVLHHNRRGARAAT